MRSKSLILILLLILPALVAPMALADTAQYKPRASVPGDMCYSTRLGSYYASDLFIPVKKSDQDIFTGLVFPGVTLASHTIVNQANLTLYFTLDFSAGSGETITIYGYEDYLEAGTFGGSAQLVYGPLTSAHVNLDVSAITSAGFYLVDVTAVVNEVLAHNWWTPGASMAFIIYGAGEDITRYISSNEWTPSQFPALDLKYNIQPDIPESGLNYNQTYKGYDIFEGHIGFRSLMFTDYTNSTQFFLKYKWSWSNYTEEYYTELTSKHVLPERTYIYNGAWAGYGIRNNYLVIGSDTWLLTDPGSQREVNLWKSSDSGANWEKMNTWTWAGTTNYPSAYTMTYNPDFDRIHVLIQLQAGFKVNYCYYDIETDFGSAITEIISTIYNLSAMDIVCDYDTDDLYVSATGGATSSSQYMHFRQRIDGSWSDKYISNNPSNYGISQTSLQWSQQNSRLTAISAFSAIGVHRIHLYLKGAAYDAWPSYNAPTLLVSLTTSLGNGVSAVLTELYPDDLKIDMIGVQYRRLERWYKSITSYPYTTATFYDPFYQSPEHDFYSGVMVLAPLSFPNEPGLSAQSDRKYFCSIEVDNDDYSIYEVFEASNFNTYYGLANHKIYQHDHPIRFMTAPKDGFGDYGVYIYLDGELVDTVNTIDDALNLIDDIVGPDPEDPAPPGWPEEGPTTRTRVILYFLILGLSLVIGPPIFMAAKKDLGLIAPVAFLMFVGAMLLLYIRYI